VRCKTPTVKYNACNHGTKKHQNKPPTINTKGIKTNVWLLEHWLTLTHKINACIIQLYVCVFIMSWLSNSGNVRDDCSFVVVDIGEIVDQHWMF
jgi:hypothetical protein